MASSTVDQMADAETLLRRLAAKIDAQEWDGLGDLLHAEFGCRYVHTGETFGREEWIRLNADYPGFGHFELLDIVASTDRAVGRAHVTGDADGVTQHFEVASFVTERDGLIAELVEVWADVGVAPPEGTRPG